jgi:hypothetical protein
MNKMNNNSVWQFPVRDTLKISNDSLFLELHLKKKTNFSNELNVTITVGGEDVGLKILIAICFERKDVYYYPL